MSEVIAPFQEALKKAFNIQSGDDVASAPNPFVPLTQEQMDDNPAWDCWDVKTVLHVLSDKQKTCFCPILKSLWLLGSKNDTIEFDQTSYEGGYSHPPPPP